MNKSCVAAALMSEGTMKPSDLCIWVIVLWSLAALAHQTSYPTLQPQQTNEHRTH